MATELLPIAGTAANSGDVVLADGESAILGLKDADGKGISRGGQMAVFLKADNNQYVQIDSINRSKPAIVVYGPATYRLTRREGVPVGAFRG